mgnify:CR=1 FL=1
MYFFRWYILQRPTQCAIYATLSTNLQINPPNLLMKSSHVVRVESTAWTYKRMTGHQEFLIFLRWTTGRKIPNMEDCPLRAWALLACRKERRYCRLQGKKKFGGIHNQSEWRAKDSQQRGKQICNILLATRSPCFIMPSRLDLQAFMEQQGPEADSCCGHSHGPLNLPGKLFWMHFTFHLVLSWDYFFVYT